MMAFGTSRDRAGIRALSRLLRSVCICYAVVGTLRRAVKVVGTLRRAVKVVSTLRRAVKVVGTLRRAVILQCVRHAERACYQE